MAQDIAESVGNASVPDYKAIKAFAQYLIDRSSDSSLGGQPDTNIFKDEKGACEIIKTDSLSRGDLAMLQVHLINILKSLHTRLHSGIPKQGAAKNVRDIIENITSLFAAAEKDLPAIKKCAVIKELNNLLNDNQRTNITAIKGLQSHLKTLLTQDTPELIQHHNEQINTLLAAIKDDDSYKKNFANIKKIFAALERAIIESSTVEISPEKRASLINYFKEYINPLISPTNNRILDDKGVEKKHHTPPPSPGHSSNSRRFSYNTAEPLTTQKEEINAASSNSTTRDDLVKSPATDQREVTEAVAKISLDDADWEAAAGSPEGWHSEEEHTGQNQDGDNERGNASSNSSFR